MPRLTSASWRSRLKRRSISSPLALTGWKPLRCAIRSESKLEEQKKPPLAATPRAVFLCSGMTSGLLGDDGCALGSRIAFDGFARIVRVEKIRQRVETHPVGLPLFLGGGVADIHHPRIAKSGPVQPA